MDRLPTFRTEGADRVDAAIAAGGFALRVVGGAVRDSLVGQVPKDVDLATDATPEEVIALAEKAGLRTIPTGLQHGTVTVVAAGEQFEVTTLRADVETDGRHAKVAFVRDWRTDAERRDFTINAMSSSLDGEVHDYFEGRSDLRAGVVRFVGDADNRIAEDYLRILRLFRFRARFGSAPDDGGALEAAGRHAGGLAFVSVERIWMEMSKLLAMPGMARQLADMARCGIDRAIRLPMDEAALARAATASLHGAPATAALGAIIEDPRWIETLAEEWKLSTADFVKAKTAALCAFRPDADLSWFKSLLAEGASPATVADGLTAVGRIDDAAVIRGGIPVFPVAGKDLLALGMSPGPEVGAILRRLKEIWKESDYKTDRDELIRSLEGHLPRP